MGDYVIKEQEIPIWKVTLDDDYVGLVDLRSPERKSYVITKFLHENLYFSYKFKIQTDKNKKAGTYTEFIIPNPKNQRNRKVLVEITEYKKLLFKTNKILDIKFLHIDKAYSFSRSSSQNSFS
jgi:hypothetical protein